MSFTNVRGSGAIALAACLVLGWSMVLEASQLTLSIGVRETGSAAAIGADGGTGGGIEWVDLDANVVPADAGWHQVTVDLANAQLTAFAGGTAKGP